MWGSTLVVFILFIHFMLFSSVLSQEVLFISLFTMYFSLSISLPLVKSKVLKRDSQRILCGIWKHIRGILCLCMFGAPGLRLVQSKMFYSLS